MLLLMMVAILSISYVMIGGLTNATTASATYREEVTGKALQRAKESLLAWVAMNAANTSELYPGRLPCPEVRSLATNATYQGYAGPFNSTTTPSSASAVACDSVGRLPWKTLGVDQIVDGEGEPLWLAVPTGTWAWSTVSQSLTINPGLANQLSFNGSTSAVAIIIAPGNALNTASDSGSPPTGCSRVSQAHGSGVPTISNFLECGNESGTYKTSVADISSS